MGELKDRPEPADAGCGPEPDKPDMEQQERLRQLETENAELKAQLQQAKAAAAAGGKKVEFSKIIFVGVSALTLAITAYSCWILYLTMDTSVLAYLIPAVFTETAAATGFYYTKAKTENKIKLMAAYGVKPDPSNFNEY